jgi:predicted SnoaL-like aldol condensation-catalyzing enzyme
MKTRFFYCFLSIALVLALHACREKTSTSTAAESTATKPEDATAKNIEVARSFYGLFEKEDWAAIEKIAAPDFVDHSPMMPTGSMSSRDTVMKYIKLNKEAFPDMKFDIMHVAADGDYVFVHYRFRGTNTGPMMGMKPTNAKLDYTGIDLVRMKDGIAQEHWDYGDNITYMRQIGMMPEAKKK